MGWWPITVRSKPVGSSRPRGRAIRPGQTLEYVGKKLVLVLLYLGPAGTTLYSKNGPDGIRLWAAEAVSYDEVLKVKKRQPPQNSSGQRHLAPLETNVLSQCHALVKHCAVTQYDDGTPRKPGWITVKTLGSAWQLEAKDPDSCCSLRVIESNLDEALLLLNMLLESEEAPWELDTWLQQQAMRAKKK